MANKSFGVRLLEADTEIKLSVSKICRSKKIHGVPSNPLKRPQADVNALEKFLRLMAVDIEAHLKLMGKNTNKEYVRELWRSVWTGFLENPQLESEGDYKTLIIRFYPTEEDEEFKKEPRFR